MYWKAFTFLSSSSTMTVVLRTSAIFFGVTSPMTRAAKAGPGKGIRSNMDFWSPRAMPTLRTPSLRSWMRDSLIL
jgi:hypothetical protein